MRDSVLVSDEIESRVDKDNLFGNGATDRIPVLIFASNKKILGSLSCFRDETENTSLEFEIKDNSQALSVLKRKIEKVIIGAEDGEAIVFQNPNIESTALFVEEDMYICKIIMNN